MAGTFDYKQAEETRDAFARHGVRYLFIKSGAILLGFPDSTQDADVFGEKAESNGLALVVALRLALERRSDVQLALVFGSVPRGTAGASSDIDVAVDAPGVDRLTLARDLSLATGREVEVVDLAAAGYPLLSAIVRDGVVVAEHSPGAEARWRTRALITLDNDRVWFERMRDGYLARLAAGG